MNQDDTNRKIAASLLEIGAIKLQPDNPFTWSSGWKSPIYCDNRLSLSYPDIRSLVKDSLSSVINSRYPECEAIAGVATAGIPQGALVADTMKLPFIYVRSKPKGHGMENLIEGRVVPGQKVVVIEDLISTGGSSLKAIEAIRAAGLEVLGLGAIFTYGFDIADMNLRQASVDYFSLSNYENLLEEAINRKFIMEEQLTSLQAWRKHPDTWESPGQ
ncbi:MAG: orotate phosphoribosyltransferase [Bacteroidetes bacterium]|nr:orotate phosphoribosyltransferase [Bacteroidota bacterium]MDA1120721.1 orotate phosphoribosyltransferase [Bacteroidota bacterium]